MGQKRGIGEHPVQPPQPLACPTRACSPRPWVSSCGWVQSSGTGVAQRLTSELHRTGIRTRRGGFVGREERAPRRLRDNSRGMNTITLSPPPPTAPYTLPGGKASLWIPVQTSHTAGNQPFIVCFLRRNMQRGQEKESQTDVWKPSMACSSWGAGNDRCRSGERDVCNPGRSGTLGCSGSIHQPCRE